MASPASTRRRPSGDEPPISPHDALWRARRRELLGMVIFAAGSVAAAVIGAELAAYGRDDTESLAWTLPNWLLTAIWLVVYAGIALAAWLVWRQGGIRRRWREIGLYSLQLALNVAWPAAYFWLDQPLTALVLVVALDVVTAATLVAFGHRSRLAAWLFAGYLVWLLYLTSLNVGIVVR